MNLYVTEDITYSDGNTVSALCRNSKVDFTAPCSNPNCKGYGTRSQYGRDESCKICGSPIAWDKEVKWS